MYRRLLRYVSRARGDLNVNVQLARVGAAAPYFYRYRAGVTPVCWFALPFARGLGISACGPLPRHAVGPEPRRFDRTAISRRGRERHRAAGQPGVDRPFTGKRDERL